MAKYNIFGFEGFTPDPDSSPHYKDAFDPFSNIPFLVALLGTTGIFVTFLVVILIWIIFFREGRISLGMGLPGQYDDEHIFLEQESVALETMTDSERQDYYRAKIYIEANPPLSQGSDDISLSQYMVIQEKGVSAWEFEADLLHTNCFVEARTEIEFFDSVSSVQTNLPIPKKNEVYYFEAKMYDKPDNTLVSVGLTTKPYPLFRLPGYHRYSVAYDSDGLKRNNQPFFGLPCGPKLNQGDIIGVGYRPRTGTVFFTRNGKRVEEVLHGLRLNLFPTIGANGPCSVHVNFGQAGFVFIEANVKKWGLAPQQGSLAPPPPYGAESSSVLLESGVVPRNGPSLIAADNSPSTSSTVSPSPSTSTYTLNTMYNDCNTMRLYHDPPPFSENALNDRRNSRDSLIGNEINGIEPGADEEAEYTTQSNTRDQRGIPDSISSRTNLSAHRELNSSPEENQNPGNSLDPITNRSTPRDTVEILSDDGEEPILPNITHSPPPSYKSDAESI
ncbi:SPRY-domain-containing protein [Nadsonia fulvescens var. elongata DSM 6958]|uniref:SPRY-domain-containing protein n=1 Tax=Nadsonia fulvescens var. elongata DSM 6958 TaxID=857566 RepID=A0A1E3PS30_9ASCO|nr:SPRY-domain-containing protein [Nadsonia fulvescens var. elongata DSM 6958]